MSKQNKQRLKDIVSQLTRYGDVTDEILDVLEVIEDINADLANGMAPELIQEGVERAKLLLDKIKGDEQ